MLEVTWSYTPLDFFEADLELSILGGDLRASRGEARFVTHVPTAIDRQTIAKITDQFRSVLDARLVLTGKRYTLSDAQFVEIDAEGRRHYTLFVDSATIQLRTGNVDLIHIASDGTTIRDTRQDRIRSETEYLDRTAAAATQSPVLARMLASYRMGFDDPLNALVYLYEIRDAAGEHFGGESQARRKLKILRGPWNQLGEIANRAPLAEGRHRGRHSSLRSVTPEELDEARQAARAIIDAFTTLAATSATV